MTSCDKRDFRDVIKLRVLRWGSRPDLSSWVQWNHRVLMGKRQDLEEKM